MIHRAGAQTAAVGVDRGNDPVVCSLASTAVGGVTCVSMTLIRDDNGKVYSLMECPHCDVHESHEAVPDRDDVFQCARCFAMFGDAN